MGCCPGEIDPSRRPDKRDDVYCGRTHVYSTSRIGHVSVCVCVGEGGRFHLPGYACQKVKEIGLLVFAVGEMNEKVSL